MEREILASSDPRESRVALLEGGQVVEAAIERHADRSVVGNIYKGRVSRVIAGMQSAFIDLGHDRDAFLHVSDLSGPRTPGTAAAPSADRPIESQLREGDPLFVQVIKEAITGKGARVTNALTLPGRYLVLVPAGEGVKVSRRIPEEAERERLRLLVEPLVPAGCGCIVRTAAAGKGETELGEDAVYLGASWRDLGRKAESHAAPTLLREELDRPLLLIRDLFGGDVSRVLVEGAELHGRILDFVAAIAPRAASRVERYTEMLPLFEARGILREIDRALRPKVWLRSGGSIVINQTEALVAVDVNTGKNLGHDSLEATIHETNLEAVSEIVRQIRLRDMGGIIVIDFIDLEGEEPRQKLLQALTHELARDRARPQISALLDSGLVQITRRRARRGLERTLCRACPDCGGSGRIKTPLTIASAIVIAIRRALAGGPCPGFVVRAHPEVVEAIRGEGDAFTRSLAAPPGLSVVLEADASLDREDFLVEVSS